MPYWYVPEASHGNVREYVPGLGVMIKDWLRKNYLDYEWTMNCAEKHDLFVAVSQKEEKRMGLPPDTVLDRILGLSIERHGPRGQHERIALLIDENLPPTIAEEAERKLRQNYVDICEDSRD